jgi:hypothetical protein
VLAVVLPWGAFAVCGGTVLALLVRDSPDGGAVLAASVGLMGWLALFFVFDFAVNFLSALLKAAREQVYLLKATVAVAVGFGVLLLALPPPTDCAGLMGAFIAAQAAWAVLLLLRVVSRWPGAAPEMPVAPGPVSAPVFSGRRCSLDEEPVMNSQPPNLVPLPLPPRAFVLALRIDNVVTALNGLGEDRPGPGGSHWRDTFREVEMWQALRLKCGELAALVCRADRPGEAAAYVLGYLPTHLEDILEPLCGRKRHPAVGGPGGGRRGPGSA